MKRRVAITGIGIVCSIGNIKEEVLHSLKSGRSGIVYHPEYAELGFRSQVHGAVRLNPDEHIDKKHRRFMGDAAAYAYLALQQAIADARLERSEVSDPRTGLILGSGGSSTANMLSSTDTLRARGARKVPPTMVPRIMASTVSAGLATAFGIRGTSYSISSACATSAHCIGNGYELIQFDKQDVVFAGGGEELHWTLTLLFDAMGALSSKYNQVPPAASRPYDAHRDGFVISGGGGVVVLEELGRAKARGAPIYAELIGYGASSDGVDMVKPSGEGAERCMRTALEGVKTPVDYINAHGTGTPAGDIIELQAIRRLFPTRCPWISSTKSLTGHALGAAGVAEAIYALLMLQHDFIAASANIQELDPGAASFPIARERIDNADLHTAMSNSFGFGGTNACLVFQRPD
ncbi:MAG: beta-ketoacyl-ACP synthase I [Gammaproteobacteria bacterium]